MCGIAGIVSRDARSDVTTAVVALTDALAHRGPDGKGYHFFRGRSVGLGHRRLSIVDLVGGAQPMANEDGRVWVILNGELYNHLQLRRELEQRGHRFATRSDTEVLVHGWEEWGEGLCGRLNGIYAFALYDDRSSGELWLARDPVGVKPLYVGMADGDWWFASELAAARRAGLLGTQLRPAAFDEYLVYRFVPSPGTFHVNAWKLPPGHLFSLGPERLPRSPAFRPFATHFEPPSVPRSRAEWSEALRSVLRAAVERQLMSDVPVGSLLSGGVDSAIITKLMREALPDPPMAFAIGFAEHPEIDELGAARRAAHLLGVPLTTQEVSGHAYLEEWPRQVAALGEPIANSSALLLGLLCSTVRATHKVVLAGQGADEPLGGYPRHTPERYHQELRYARPLLAYLPERWLASDRVARLRRIADTTDEASRFTETLAVFGPKEAVALTGHQLDPAALVDPVRRWVSPEVGNDGDSLNNLLRVDARLSLADDLLIVADHMSMARSVELRVPFLDLEFLALAELMPSRYKISCAGQRKWLYRKAVAPLLPASLSAMLGGWKALIGPKFNFSTPLDAWFKRWVALEGEEYLLGTGAITVHYLRSEGIMALLSEARDRGTVRSRQLMSLYVLEGWLRGTHVIESHSRS